LSQSRDQSNEPERAENCDFLQRYSMHQYQTSPLDTPSAAAVAVTDAWARRQA